MELAHVIFKSVNSAKYFKIFFPILDNLTFGASASVVQAALSDLPTLSETGRKVKISSTLTLSGSYVNNITFSADYGIKY
jgi:hypothetical protein